MAGGGFVSDNPVRQTSLKVQDFVLDAVTQNPIANAYVESEIINLPGFPSIGADPASPSSAPVITNASLSGPNGQFTLDVTWSGQGVQYPVRVNVVDPTGLKFGSSGPYVGH